VWNCSNAVNEEQLHVAETDDSCKVDFIEIVPLTRDTDGSCTTECVSEDWSAEVKQEKSAVVKHENDDVCIISTVFKQKQFCEDTSWQIKLRTISVITFCVSRSRRKMYCGHARLCVCLSVAVRPHYCTDPDVIWGHGRGCPLVVHYWADLQSGHGLRCYGNITRTLVTSLRPYRDMTT